MTTDRIHHPGLDGLRGVAVLLVLGFHAGLAGTGGGFLGVSLFFTLSGFLITGLLLYDVDDYGSPDLRRFWVRRARRLLPASLLCLTVVAMAAPWVWPNLGQRLLFAFGYVANWGAVWQDSDYANILTGIDPLAHFWSLAIEEQFYLIWPLLFWAGARRFGSSRTWMYVLCLTVICWAGVAYLLADGSGARVYYGTDTRAAEVAVGALLAVAVHRRQQVLDRLGEMVLPFTLVTFGGFALTATVSLSTPWVYRGGLVGVAVVSACAIVAAIVPGPGKSLLSHRWLQAVGRVSYGLYLWHWPLFVLIGTDTPVRLVVAFAATAAVSYVSYRFVENPIRRGHVRPRLLAVAGGVAATVIVAAAVVTWPDPTAGLSRHYGEHVRFTGLENVGIATGNAETEPLRVVVLGDSVAQSATWGLARSTSATQGSIEVIGLAVAACPVTGDRYASSVNDTTGNWNPDCDPARWKEVVEQYRPDVAVVIYSIMNQTRLRIDGTWGVIGEPVTDTKIVEAMAGTVDFLESAGVDTVLWADVPDIPGGRAGKITDPVRVRRHNELVDELVAQRPTVAKVPLWQWVTELVPDVRETDGVHFSEEGSVRLADERLADLLADVHAQTVVEEQ